MQSKKDKPIVHFADQELTQCVNPILVNVIGVGGTGSHVLKSLADMNLALNGLGHPGFVVRAFDEDTVSQYNRGRQRFASAEIGEPKAAALINRINRFYGTYWKAMLYSFSSQNEDQIKQFLSAQITISCVDTVKSRFDIEDILKRVSGQLKKSYARDKPTYWLDYGNGRNTGQVFLSTLRDIDQPDSKAFVTVPQLPLFTEEFRVALQSVDDHAEPSCSMQEALHKQDLFINPGLAMLGCRLLWTLLTEGMTPYRGVFLNLTDYRTVPIPVTCRVAA